MIIGNKFHSRQFEPESALGPDGGFESPNRFLFAEVGVEQNGMALSVLSMLSRQDVDPWDEAAYLAACPKREAVARLAARVADASIGLANPCDPSAVAVALIGLLPARDNGLPAGLLSRGAADQDLRFGAGGKPPYGRRREGGSAPRGARNPQSSRLLTLVFVSLISAAIMAAAPQHIWSVVDGAQPTVSTTQLAPSAPAHPSRWYR